jgi:hypothetical protein
LSVLRVRYTWADSAEEEAVMRPGTTITLAALLVLIVAAMVVQLLLAR